MRSITIISFLFLIANISKAGNLNIDTIKHTNKTPSVHSTRTTKQHLYYYDCVFIKKYSLANRLKKYPFSKAVKILAVSYFPPNIAFYEEDSTKTSTYLVYKSGLHVNNDTLNHSSLREIKELTPTQVDQLSNLIFNTDFRKIGTLQRDYPNACFDPRNAFIFFDKNGKVFDYIEVCFECHQYESRSTHLSFGIGCNQKLDLVKQFLISVGIHYGTQTIE